ncbi:Nuf2 family-domain-containing protein [Suillus fuscotomentosus]|uniref:Nuf2 family-domain-containing protein n=1 Tax=Suillus fuscotomentosus TaxID=1912939 RepID=A0AAD4ED37_9AGAM|nr:Nuf2 family-domain-containing protein [Suillus fuscotomentosus]KAG1904029.1 Nuf2 family-domain-containing protein [Suillus fuscotomentosus]
MSGQYWFPNMPIPEIMTALSEWGLSVSNEQLVRPSSDFVTGVYNACLEQVTSISPNVLHKPTQRALASLDDANPDLYNNAISHNIMLYHLTRFATSARIMDFSSRDLSAPEPERTRFILSAFINFVKFAEQCTTFISNVREKSAQVIEEREQVIQELSEVQHNLAVLKAQRAKDEPKCEQLKEENAAMTTQLLAAKEVHTGLTKEIESLKIERAHLQARNETVNSESALLMDNNSRTRSRIVQSPERIRRNIMTMGTTAIEDKKTVALHEAKARDLQAKISALVNIEKDVRSCIEQLQTTEKEVQLLEGSQKELAELKDSLEYKKVERGELQKKTERVHKQLGNAHEKLERAQRHAEEKRQASQQTVERLQRDYEKMDIERRENDKQVEELRMEAGDIETKMAEHLKKSEAELNELLTDYWKLRHETEVYMETLANKLNMNVSSD